MNDKPASMRLDKLLANLGYGSRKDVQKLAKQGEVVLDGKPLKKLDARIELTPDLNARLQVMGNDLDPLPGLAIIMHKPLGVTCSHNEAGELVFDLLPWRWRLRNPAISTIGRLDKQSSGLLLLTDDGQFLHRVIAPSSQLGKRYRVTLSERLHEDTIAVFASGEMMLEGEDKPLLPAVLEPVSDREAHVTITEGRYHQVRRMFATIGNYVETLHRDRIGGLALEDGLAAGEWRLMSQADKERLFS